MRVFANGLEFEVDDQGPPNGEALMLIMGLGMQLIAWPDDLVADLVGRGFRVIRFDNRDIGLSSHLDHLGVPNLVGAALRHTLHLKVRAPYTVQAMAEDALGVLDALGIARAHVCGASMGGMIAQHLAARHPQRVSSLTLLMTSSGARGLPQPSWAVRQAMMSRPDGSGLDATIAHYERLFHVIGSPAYRPDPVALRQRLERSVRRSYHPAGVVRQMVAIAADGDRSAMLKQIQAPTHVIHGEADPLIPVGAAHDLLRKIAGASRDLIPGMGHDLPAPLLPRLAAGMAMNAARA